MGFQPMMGFKRVFAGPDGEVHACRECADRDALLNGAAAHPAPGV